MYYNAAICLQGFSVHSRRTVEVVTLGAKNSGKTQIIHRLFCSLPFSERPLDWDPVYWVTKYYSRIKLSIWDLSHEMWECRKKPRLNSLVKDFYAKAEVVLYCIDLSQEMNEIAIQNDINAFRQINPDANLILIGTKCDLGLPDAERQFLNLNLEVTKRIITSLKFDIGIEELCESILSCKRTMWDICEQNLLDALKHLPFDKCKKIEHELDFLYEELGRNSDKEQCIKNFVLSSQKILEGSHPYFINAVLTFASAIVVTLILVSVGFTGGLALGLWTSPFVLLSAFLKGSPAAIFLGSTGIGSGICTAGFFGYNLFKESKEMGAIKRFAEEINCSLSI
ncbi:hypothetical protein EAW55_06790 [Legionella jordanis]|uniref:Rho GTPase (Miro-like) n=1 Tax=Legionella jordanis TaxID=456 RepID=A0A0W0VA63_9GAMM|nr:GTPase domain-containing protein [Legionella jordanis]KTD16992.1 Rho GTPase (Miro-like) [Legionella jordanis]RMX03132.1 hypothetical protein EAW55_06790 [Legionella jordanis]VEH12813.1 Rho GTPase (Miro-like) [Legionella jordanis]